jgi:alkylmercury lyase
VVGVVLQERVGEIEHLEDALVGDAVVDRAVLAARVDEAAPAQAGEMRRDLRLGGGDELDQLPDGALAVSERLENPNASRVAEAAEVLGDDVDFDWLRRELERGFGDGGHIGRFPYIDTADLADQLSRCAQDPSDSERRLQLALLRLLAEGRPVEPTRLVAKAGVPAADMVERLGRRWGVRTDAGRVVGFQGLSVVETRHRLELDGRTLFTWCAWDTLFLPELLGGPAKVESSCPASGATMSMRVGPEGVSHVAPPAAVMSFVDPDGCFGEDVIQSFCRFVNFFASRKAALPWTQTHPGTYVISIADGFEIGRRVNARWGDLL